jgi:hypothetical protein
MSVTASGWKGTLIHLMAVQCEGSGREMGEDVKREKSVRFEPFNYIMYPDHNLLCPRIREQIDIEQIDKPRPLSRLERTHSASSMVIVKEVVAAVPDSELLLKPFSSCLS